MRVPDLREQVKQVLCGGPLDHDAFANGEQAGASFRSLAEKLELGGSDGVLADLLGKIVASAEPAMALNNLQRFVEASPEPQVVRDAMRSTPDTATTLVALTAGSQFLSDVLIAQPDAFSWLVSHETLHENRSPDYYQDGAARVVAELDDRVMQRAALSHWRRREYLRIGCRDLLGLADAEDVSRDISDLAQAIIDRAAAIVYAELSRRFGEPVPEASSWDSEGEASREGDAASPEYSGMCVLGMGKLGGRELNFSSDIDLIFVYEAEGETTGRMENDRRVAVISNHDFFVRMGEQLVKFLGERLPEGNLFRVDMRLRPEGLYGPLARSLESFVHYLNTQARDWERLAYLKARVVSGPVRLAQKLYRVMAEFVYAGQDAGRIVSEVQGLKLRIDREVMNSDTYRLDVKRGYGGIREIEFVIAAMQIIHGHTHHALRVRNTFLAIQRLRETHIVSDEDAEFYLETYSFLRMVEHRLQMAQEAQTHTLLQPGREADAMARRCGFPDHAAFMTHYERLTDDVHGRFTRFFEHDTDAVEQATRDVVIILDRGAASEEVDAALERRGLPTGDTRRLIHALAYGTRDVFVSAGGQRSFEQMLPALLRLTAAAPFPEQVLSQLHSFALAMKGITYYYEVISQHPDILKLLVTLFGTSEAMSARLVAHPEFFDALISSRLLNEIDPEGEGRRERMRAGLSVRSPMRKLAMLRRGVQFEQLVLALKYLLRIEPLPECLRGLSATADTAIELGARLAVARLLARKLDVARPENAAVEALVDALSTQFAVLGLGKYGGLELNFFGDLDVVFVYDDARPLPAQVADWYTTPQEFFDALADALIGVLSEQLADGRAFMVDSRLRPHGKSAPLAVAFSNYTAYLEAEAETWELQAFHRARTVWGNGQLAARLHGAAQASAKARDAAAVAGEVHEMRVKLEKSVTAVDVLEIKRSPGGIVDIEFLVQYLVLAGRLPWSRSTANYFECVDTHLESAIGANDAALVKAAYGVLRGVENTIRLVTGGTGSEVALQSANALGVARSLGFGSVELLKEQVDHTREKVREVYCRHILGA